MKNLMYRASIEMFLMRQKARDLLTNKSGVTMIEYSILLGIITALVIATIVLISGRVQSAWTGLETAWGNATGT